MADIHVIPCAPCNLCILCFRVIDLTHERYLISGKSKFNIKEAIHELPFKVCDSSPYICRHCLDKLRKRVNLITQERNITEELCSLFQKGKSKRDNEFTADEPPTKRPSLVNVESETVQTTTHCIKHCIKQPYEIVDTIKSHQPSRVPTPIAHSTPVKERSPIQHL